MKTSLIQIDNLTYSSRPILAKNCTSFLQNLKGLMFEPALPENGGILLDEHSESRLNTSIHMLFMNFDITAVWIDSQYQVVDVRLAKKWALAYFPKSPARYVLETSAQHFHDFHIGDLLEFSNVS
jgi:uncharacterized membrane protein (UPF0127 family)